MEVLLYQIGIFLAIQIAAKIGKNSRNTAIVLISIFTILQVFMSWLLVLQFITIFISYIVSKNFSSKEKTNTNSSEKNEVNLEVKQKKLITKLKKESNTEEKRKTIKEIKKIDEINKKRAINEFNENPSSETVNVKDIDIKKLYTVEEVHSLNSTLSSDPETHARLTLLRRDLSKSHPNINIIMVDDLNKTLGINSNIDISGNTIYISPEIVYQPETIFEEIEKKEKERGITSFKNNVGKNKTTNKEHPELQEKLQEKLINKKIELKTEINSKLKKGQIGKIIDVFDIDCFAVEFYDKRGNNIILNNKSIFFIGILDFIQKN